MRIHASWPLLIPLYFAVGTLTTGSAMDVEMRYAVISIKPFEDVLEDLRFAITEQNFRITSLNRIGQAISEREEIQFPPVAVVHFCNLGLAQEILELDSNYALLMPCRVSIHERDKRIIVQTYLLPEHDPRLADISKRINFMLKNIVNYAALE